MLELSLPGAAPESVERGPRMWEIGNSVSSRINPMPYKIDTCVFLARRKSLLVQGKVG